MSDISPKYTLYQQQQQQYTDTSKHATLGGTSQYNTSGIGGGPQGTIHSNSNDDYNNDSSSSSGSSNSRSGGSSSSSSSSSSNSSSQPPPSQDAHKKIRPHKSVKKPCPTAVKGDYRKVFSIIKEDQGKALSHSQEVKLMQPLTAKKSVPVLPVAVVVAPVVKVKREFCEEVKVKMRDGSVQTVGELVNMKKKYIMTWGATYEKLDVLRKIIAKMKKYKVLRKLEKSLKLHDSHLQKYLDNWESKMPELPMIAPFLPPPYIVPSLFQLTPGGLNRY